MFTQAISNKYGMVLDSAVFMVSSATADLSKSHNMSLNSEDVPVFTSSTNVNVSFAVKYWISQEAKDAGSQAIMYEAEGTDMYAPTDRLRIEGIEYSQISTEEDLLELCESYFKNEILT